MLASRSCALARPVALAGLVAGLVAVLPGCGGTVPPPGPPPGVSVASITVTSKAFTPNGQIPVDYTCDGKDISPPLTWSAPPPGTKSLVILVDDPDAPSGNFTHWLLFGLPQDRTSLPEAADAPALGARTGMNDFQNVRYAGPCPPRGSAHRYRYHVVALDTTLEAGDGASRAQLDTAMNGHVLGEGVLLGIFSH